MVPPTSLEFLQGSLKKEGFGIQNLQMGFGHDEQLLASLMRFILE